MFYHIFYPLSKYFFAFNVTKYITFRAGCAFITSFIIVLALWSFTLKRLKRLQIIEKIDMYGHVRLESLYAGKKGTPTMGGILIIFSILISSLLWARWDNYFLWLSIFVLLSLGAVGLLDDLQKTKTGKGFSRRKKLVQQIIIGVALGLFVVLTNNLSTVLDFPFFKKIAIELGYFYVFWAALIIVSTSNAVNFTDGLDGLAIGAIIINSLFFGFLSYLAGNAKFSNYLLIPFIENAGELAIICFSLVGAGLAFLWYNSYPAEVFMGDVGALSMGGLIGAIALFIKKEFLLIITGGLFVLEALSVILQILSVRLRGKKIFKAAPFHHHLQLIGWKEPKIIIRLWIVSIMCAVISILTLKLR